nr:MAG TPA: hypothetical protein [Bacteriophage sp.]
MPFISAILYEVNPSLNTNSLSIIIVEAKRPFSRNSSSSRSFSKS